jgi:hypothetical protein
VVDAPAFKAAPEQVAQVPSIAATRVEYPRPSVEPAFQELIEQIDVDVAELASERWSGRRGHPGIIPAFAASSPALLREEAVTPSA